jgi:hypothetical protein
MWAISVQQPFAWAIIHGGKNIENRIWQPKGIKPGDKLAIVASKTWYPVYKDGREVRWKRIASDLKLSGVAIMPSGADFLLGGLIGTVTFQGVARDKHLENVWAMEDQYHFLLGDPQPLPFRPIRGQLGLYQIDLT